MLSHCLLNTLPRIPNDRTRVSGYRRLLNRGTLRAGSDDGLLKEIQYPLKLNTISEWQRHRQWCDSKIALAHHDNLVKGGTVIIQFVEKHKAWQAECFDSRPGSDEFAPDPQ